MSTSRLYLDWNATAPLCEAARVALVDAMGMPGNPSSVHAEGRAARAALEKARRQVATLAGRESAAVVFTSGATEAANLVLTPDFRMGRSPLRIGHLYVSAIEHPAIREGGRFAPDRISEIPVLGSGQIDLDALAQLLRDHDAGAGLPMVAVMLANNETGILQPVDEVAALTKSAGGVLVVDAVQAAGKMDLAVAGDADFLIFSSHKIGGPKGVGVLVAKGEALMPVPLIRGGGQEKGHRSGTENFPAIVGFGAAAEDAVRALAARMEHMAHLRDQFEEGARRAAPDVIIHGAYGPRLANTSFFSLPGLKSETGQIAFDLEGIALSAGSACSSGRVGESHVLAAMGFDPALGALRLSVGPTTGEEEIARAVQAFARIAGRRRAKGAA